MTTRKKKAAKAVRPGKKKAKKIATISASREPEVKVKKEQITLRLDADVIDYFRALGVGYQAQMSGYLGMPMADERIRVATGIQGTPFWEERETRKHEAMANRIFRPRKEQITLRVDADTLEWFRSRGKGYQSKMNRVLRLMMVEMLRGDERKPEEED
jgi:uncharacterized protein (DUF4415 family)